MNYKALVDILTSIRDITNSGWAGIIILAIAGIAAVTAFIMIKMKTSHIAKHESDKKAAKDHAQNPIINDDIESKHEAAEDLINRNRPSGNS